MPVYIQLSCVAYDDIESPEERALLGDISGDEHAANFVELIDGDESLIRATSLAEPYCEQWTPQDFTSMLHEVLRQEPYLMATVVLDANIDGVSDILQLLGFEEVRSFHIGERTYRRYGGFRIALIDNEVGELATRPAGPVFATEAEAEAEADRRNAADPTLDENIGWQVRR